MHTDSSFARCLLRWQRRTFRRILELIPERARVPWHLALDRGDLFSLDLGGGLIWQGALRLQNAHRVHALGPVKARLRVAHAHGVVCPANAVPGVPRQVAVGHHRGVRLGGPGAVLVHVLNDDAAPSRMQLVRNVVVPGNCSLVERLPNRVVDHPGAEAAVSWDAAVLKGLGQVDLHLPRKVHLRPGAVRPLLIVL
eukprot:CAMPEP_0114255296 /NCGR_PEP_ID=MMETSP0058-20121206/17473_1 /TAXON_ID=36894 /ORGANISM="Pyramimonas parkeae, CCMP726" /LENGTH=195 /DNA_ID=CAMNT_0001369645 /DNA_START=488 /DNA_END=1076 /DNA_ORIENTATION=-